MNQNIKKLGYCCISAMLLLGACKPDNFADFENPIQDENIKLVTLTSDSESLLADGKATMEFRFLAYGIAEVKKLKKEVKGKETIYSEYMQLDTFLIPSDRISPDFIKLYSADGTLIKDNKFRTTALSSAKINFHAKAGNVISNSLAITLREDKVSAAWQEIEIPLMFHIMEPPSAVRPTFTISVENLQLKVDQLNRVYNNQVAATPNGGNAKIKFVLAKYDLSGRLLAERGMRKVAVVDNMNLAGYKEVIAKNLWNPAQYLNVYLCKFADNYNPDGSLSYAAPMPNMILKGASPIPGITAREVPAFNSNEVKDVTDVSIIWSLTEFFDPSRWDKDNALEFSTVMGYHLGLLNTEAKSVYNSSTGKYDYVLVNGDSDYCPDTEVYTSVGNFSVFKKALFTDKLYTAFNIMTGISRKNSITVDQSARIREVLEKCPSRWYYKSKWATTGLK